MLCTKCGHENPPSAKFCNECGTTTDRRKGERRQGDRRRPTAADPQEGVASGRPTPLPSLTPGQENAQGHSPAVRAAESYLRGERPFRGPEQAPVEDARENGASQRSGATAGSRGNELRAGSVSGPSFLGLAGDSGSSADYLLDDEPHNGWRKWAVLLVLIVVGVLFYLQWKNSWGAQPAPPPPAPSAPAPVAPQGNAAPAGEATGVPAAKPQEASQQPDQPASSTPQADAAKDPAAVPAKDQAKPADPAAAKKDESAADEPSDQPDNQASAKPEPKPVARERKPDADRSSSQADAQNDPMLFMAQKYLYGQGVRRDCDQAMVYLRAANQKASAPARSQMGALYATGHCVPLDRVRAYQWFTSALNLDPSSPDLQRERNHLWAQMSSSQRQQAVK